jgi:hypothetical protein
VRAADVQAGVCLSRTRVLVMQRHALHQGSVGALVGCAQVRAGRCVCLGDKGTHSLVQLMCAEMTLLLVCAQGPAAHGVCGEACSCCAHACTHKGGLFDGQATVCTGVGV